MNGTTDDECDDGGPGSEWSLCEIGTDCDDCGIRHPSSPPALPPAVPPPASPQSPGSELDDTVDNIATPGGDDGASDGGGDDTFEDVAGDVPLGVDSDAHDDAFDFGGRVLNETSSNCSDQRSSHQVNNVSVSVWSGAAANLSDSALSASPDVTIVLPDGFEGEGASDGGDDVCGGRTGVVAVTVDDVDAVSDDGGGAVASDVVSVHWCSTGLTSCFTDGAGPSPPPLADPATIALRVDATLAIGTAPCVQPLLLNFAPSNDTCVAGCCVDGTCRCREGYYGARCEYELKCASASGDEPRWDLDHCATMSTSDHMVNCSCTSVEYVAALRFRLTPAANVDWYTLGVRIRRSTNPLAWIVPLSIYGLLAAWAIWRDWRTLYSTQLPPWMQPPRGRFWLYGQLLLHLRTRQAMLRVYHVMPDHTAYSTLQLMHLFFSTICATFVAVIIFLNKRQCTAEAAVLAGVLAGSTASLPVVLGRVLFKWANRQGRRKKAYKANKQSRHEWWIAGADGGKGFKDAGPSPLGGGKALPSPQTTPLSCSDVGVTDAQTTLSSSHQGTNQRRCSWQIGQRSSADASTSKADSGKVRFGGLVSERRTSAQTRTNFGALSSTNSSGNILIGGEKLPPQPLSGHTRRPKAASSQQRPSEVMLSPNKLFSSPDGRGGVGILLATGDKVGGRKYVPATHVSAPVCGFELLVTLDADALPAGRSAQTLQEREMLTHDGSSGLGELKREIATGVGGIGLESLPPPADLSRTQLKWQQVLAWSYNIVFGATALVLLVVLMLGASATDSAAEKLRADGLSLEEWRRSVVIALSWTFFQSLVLVDGAKVLMLTATSPVFMKRLPKGSLRRLLGTKVLRQAHRLLDVIL